MQTADHLRTFDPGHVGACGMPELHPEGSRVAVNGKGRAIVHHRHRFRDSAIAQFFEQLATNA